MPHPRTNYGTVGGFFSLVASGEPTGPGHLERRIKNDKSSSFFLREVRGAGPSWMLCLPISGHKRIGVNPNVYQQLLFSIPADRVAWPGVGRANAPIVDGFITHCCRNFVVSSVSNFFCISPLRAFKRQGFGGNVELRCTAAEKKGPTNKMALCSAGSRTNVQSGWIIGAMRSLHPRHFCRPRRSSSCP